MALSFVQAITTYIFFRNCIHFFVCLASFPFDYMERVGGYDYTAASHQGVIKMFWLLVWHTWNQTQKKMLCMWSYDLYYQNNKAIYTKKEKKNIWQPCLGLASLHKTSRGGWSSCREIWEDLKGHLAAWVSNCTPDSSIKHLNPMRVKEWRETRMNVVLHKRTEGENNFLLVFFLFIY